MRIARAQGSQGLTLVEVLIAVGLLSLGLLGVAAIFPVGGYYVQSGDQADRAGSIAQAALEDAITRGHLNPDNWTILDIDRLKSTPVATAVQPRPLSLALRGAETGLRTAGTIANTVVSNGTLSRGEYLCGAYGTAFAIDPLGMAEGLEPDSTVSPAARVFQNFNDSQRLRRFPASSGGVAYQAVAQAGPSWRQFDLSSGGIPTWPVRRVTPWFRAAEWDVNLGLFATREPAAEALFAATDDLAVSLPEDGDSPARARWKTWATGAANSALPSIRQSRGDYSWLITVAPGTSEALASLATRPDAFPVDVSVVVFYKRVLGRGYSGMLEAERLVNARVVSTSTSGGELLLDRRPAAEDPEPTSPFADLRAGQYVMLVGPHPQSTRTNPALFLQWYRVLQLQDSGTPALSGLSTAASRLSRDGTNARVLAQLRGPDWPWRPASTLADNTQLANDLRVAIIPGAVAVHTKTMRLEAASAWSAQ